MRRSALLTTSPSHRHIIREPSRVPNPAHRPGCRQPAMLAPPDGRAPAICRPQLWLGGPCPWLSCVRCSALCRLFLSDVPQLCLKQRDKARRFITLIDQLYNHKTCLIASTAVPIDELFSGLTASTGSALDSMASLEGLEFEGEVGKTAELNPIGNTANSLDMTAPSTGEVAADSRKGLLQDSLFTGEDETFAFRRAVSRLHEMQSEQYLYGRVRTLSVGA
jgi:hypothetical protein